MSPNNPTSTSLHYSLYEEFEPICSGVCAFWPNLPLIGLQNIVTEILRFNQI